MQVSKHTREAQAEERKRARKVLDEEKALRKRKREDQLAQLAVANPSGPPPLAEVDSAACTDGPGDPVAVDVASKGSPIAPPSEAAGVVVAKISVPSRVGSDTPSFELPDHLCEFRGDPGDRYVSGNTVQPIHRPAATKRSYSCRVQHAKHG